MKHFTRGLWDKQPFNEKHEVLASFSIQNITISNILTIIQYSLIEPSEIRGKIVGSAEMCTKLMPIFSANMPYFCFTSEINNGQIISSKNGMFKSMKLMNQSINIDKKMIDTIAELNFLELKIKEQFKETPETTERHLTFFLSGPRRHWPVRTLKTGSPIGDIKVKLIRSTIEVTDTLPFKIEILPYYFHAEDPTRNNFEMTTSVMALHFSTDYSYDHLSNDEYIHKAIAVADDLILLTSFISRKWIRWYRYCLETNNLVESFIRRVSLTSCSEPDLDNGLIDFADFEKFVKVAFKSLQKLRQENFDLSVPIYYYISSNETQFLEDKYAILFLALEKIKALYARSQQIEYLMDKTSFKQLKIQVEDIIKKQQFENEDQIIEKIPELKRRSIKNVIKSMLNKLNITWNDIYPPGTDFTFVDTRNKLFHTDTPVDMEFLAKEYERLRIIVERIIFSYLGWSSSPSSLIKSTQKWLTDTSGC